jgi:hypothetical protein
MGDMLPVRLSVPRKSNFMASAGSVMPQIRVGMPRIPVLTQVFSSCRQGGTIVDGAAWAPRLVSAARFLIPLPGTLRRAPLGRDVGDRIPGVVDPPEEQEQRDPAGREQRGLGMPLERDPGRRQHRVGDERQSEVPDPVLEHRLVGGLPTRVPDDGRPRTRRRQPVPARA